MGTVDLKNNEVKTGKYEFSYHNECPVCASRNIEDKYKLKDKYKLTDYYIVSKCRACSVLFVKEIVTEDFLKKFYQKLMEADYIYEDENQNFLDYYYNKLRTEIEKIKPAKGAVLDIGCSAGFFLKQMEGWEKHGIEISEKFGNMAKEKIGASVYIGSFEDYPVKKNYFDVITLQDVFDHFIDPNKNLKKCHDMLKPGGLLVIKVHNASCLYAKIKGENFYAIIPPFHLFYYNEKSLKYILNKTGFKFFGSKFIAHKLQLKTVFYRLSRDDKNSIYYKMCNLLKNNMLGNIAIHKNLHDIITVFAVKDQIKEKS